MGAPIYTYHHYFAGAGGTLREAQVAKLDAMLAAAEVCAGDHVLEIGCGWGSMAIHAVQTTGCRWGACRAVVFSKFRQRMQDVQCSSHTAFTSP